jgi:hypothetical protein
VLTARCRFVSKAPRSGQCRGPLAPAIAPPPFQRLAAGGPCSPPAATAIKVVFGLAGTTGPCSTPEPLCNQAISPPDAPHGMIAATRTRAGNTRRRLLARKAGCTSDIYWKGQRRLGVSRTRLSMDGGSVTRRGQHQLAQCYAQCWSQGPGLNAPRNQFSESANQRVSG